MSFMTRLEAGRGPAILSTVTILLILSKPETDKYILLNLRYVNYYYDDVHHNKRNHHQEEF